LLHNVAHLSSSIESRFANLFRGQQVGDDEIGLRGIGVQRKWIVGFAKKSTGRAALFPKDTVPDPPDGVWPDQPDALDELIQMTNDGKP
jgi:hypothetical protein